MTTDERKPPHLIAAETDEEEADEARAVAEQEPDEDDETRPPPWAKIPERGKGKARGFPGDVSIWFVPLQVRLMRRRSGGEMIKLKDGSQRLCRQVILWELDLDDQKRAFGRAGGDVNRASDELALQMIRAVDGEWVDWTNEQSPQHPRRIWSDMGPKLRNLLHRLYTAMHVLGDVETTDFFVNCVDVRKTL